jgi:hypothetical protein|tara:strand:+ start:145 stop:396 length:252 start_codon:yes stop_codon:yes gene_type:complete
MSTKRTPIHKRVARAEKAQENWKVKAIERREEAEKWKATANRKTDRIGALEEKYAESERKLADERRKNEKLKNELEEQKKNYP